MDSIGQRIRQLRKEADVSQQEVGDQTGIARGNISNYEKGRVTPSADTIIALARFFKVSADWLLTGKDWPFGEKQIERRMESTRIVQVDREENKVIQMYREFSPKDREFIRQIMVLKRGQGVLGREQQGDPANRLMRTK